MDSPAACSSCAMPTADESNHSAAWYAISTPHRQTPFPFQIRLTHISKLSEEKYCELSTHESNIIFCFKNTPLKPMERKPPKPAFPLGMWIQSNAPILLPTPLTTQIGPRSNHPFCHSTPCGQTDRPTHGIGDRPVRIPAYAQLYYSDTATE